MLQEERPQHANPRLFGLLLHFRSMRQMCRWLRRRPILTRRSVTATSRALTRRPLCCLTAHRPRSSTPPRYRPAMHCISATFTTHMHTWHRFQPTNSTRVPAGSYLQLSVSRVHSIKAWLLILGPPLPVEWLSCNSTLTQTYPVFYLYTSCSLINSTRRLINSKCFNCTENSVIFLKLTFPVHILNACSVSLLCVLCLGDC